MHYMKNSPAIAVALMTNWDDDNTFNPVTINGIVNPVTFDQYTNGVELYVPHWLRVMIHEWNVSFRVADDEQAAIVVEHDQQAIALAHKLMHYLPEGSTVWVYRDQHDHKVCHYLPAHLDPPIRQVWFNVTEGKACRPK